MNKECANCYFNNNEITEEPCNRCEENNMWREQPRRGTVVAIPQIESNGEFYAISSFRVVKGEIVEVTVFDENLVEYATFEEGEFRIVEPMFPVKNQIGLEKLIKLIR